MINEQLLRIKTIIRLVENVNEVYPTSFNIEEFKQLKSFNQRIQYCEQHLQRISSGSSRIVYKIDDEKVLKLAKNKKGLAQNKAEIDYGTEIYLEGIVANIFEYEENGLWVEMELAKKITEGEFKRISGFNFKDFAAALNNYYHERTNYRNGYKMEVDSEIVAEMWEDEFVYGIFQYLGNYKVTVGDLTRLSTYGIVKRDGQDTIVLIDYGLTEDVYKSHYSEQFVQKKLGVDITNPLVENVVIDITKNMEPAPNMGSTFGQDVEPKGTYVTQGFIDYQNYVNGKAYLKNPLFINVTDTTLIEYKRELAKKYKAKGQALTNKLMKLGYDSIITVWEDGKYGEIVLFPNASFMLT
jgi:hypothetical protein